MRPGRPKPALRHLLESSDSVKGKYKGYEVLNHSDIWLDIGLNKWD